jgi:hypothetical protein
LPLYLPWCLRLGTAMGPLTPQLVRPQSDDIHRLRDFGRGAADAGFVPKRGDTLVTGFGGGGGGADAGFGPKATTYVGYGVCRRGQLIRYYDSNTERDVGASLSLAQFAFSPKKRTRHKFLYSSRT